MRLKKIFRLGQGFTIVELLIAVTLAGILTSAGIAAYRGLGEKQKVKQAGMTMVTNLKNIQQKALASEKPEECDDPDELEGYRVSYVDSDTYEIRAICSIAIPSETELNLTEGVEFSSSFSVINFYVLRPQIDGAQTITIGSDDYSYEVTIEASGVIYGEMLE